MRIRTMKPEIRRDEVVCSWDYAVRWTFAGLFMYCDDEGRGRDDARLIKADLYPIDDEMDIDGIEHHLKIMAEAGPLCRYQVDGRRYLHLLGWRHQRVNRPTPSTMPACPKHGVRSLRRRTEDSVSDHEQLTPPSVEDSVQPPSEPEQQLTDDSPGERKGKEGKGKENNHRSTALSGEQINTLFDEFWSAYPRRVGKSAAQRKFATLLRAGTPAQAIIDGAHAYAAQMLGKDALYVAHPTTWLNAGRWEDEHPTSAGTLSERDRARLDPNGAAWPAYDPLGERS